MKPLHGAHDTEDVGVHHPFEVRGLDIGARRILDGQRDVRGDEQQGEAPGGEAFPESGDLIEISDVEVSDRLARSRKRVRGRRCARVPTAWAPRRT
ncbi:hypothetical protein [Propionibacterium freudenreichii]|uniref:hypothetical protein n=1 Tax=Propionibacterium freudenreichii TaxID=1744 RepID=UPI0004A10428|nr:hypothetical protein [Propionibacterium freudenreichii]CDP48225.1 Putative uncharacterized protein [Propionibacterium freudenreichii subsp. freudenreichii]